MNPLPPPGKDLLRQVRAGFVARGTSLQAWALEHGHTRQFVSACLTGAKGGPAAQAMRAKATAAAGLPTQESPQ